MRENGLPHRIRLGKRTRRSEPERRDKPALLWLCCFGDSPTLVMSTSPALKPSLCICISKNCARFSFCACPPFAGAMLVFSVSFRCYPLLWTCVGFLKLRTNALPAPSGRGRAGALLQQDRDVACLPSCPLQWRTSARPAATRAMMLRESLKRKGVYAPPGSDYGAVMIGPCQQIGGVVRRQARRLQGLAGRSSSMTPCGGRGGALASGKPAAPADRQGRMRSFPAPASAECTA